MAYAEYATESQEPMESPGFAYGVGTTGEFHVDGTPMRVATIVAVAVLLAFVINRGGLRFHVAG